jgi:hypothetical protein
LIGKSALVEVAHAFCFITIVNSKLSNPNQPRSYTGQEKKRDNEKEEENGNGHLCHAIFSTTEGKGKKDKRKEQER